MCATSFADVNEHGAMVLHEDFVEVRGGEVAPGWPHRAYRHRRSVETNKHWCRGRE